MFTISLANHLHLRMPGRLWMLAVLAIVATSIVPSAQAQSSGGQEPHLSDEVLWTGKNGRSIRAVYAVEHLDVINVIEAGTQKHFQLKRETLSPETLDWYLRARARAEYMKQVEDEAGAITPEADTKPANPLLEPPPGYESLAPAKLDRTEIPTLDQAKYGHKASDCVPNAYAMFFMWWDEHANLKIPRGRNFDDKAEWIHKELARAFGTRNNRGTYYDDVDSGLTEFFERRYADTATIKAHREYDIRPASLAPHVAGGHATILCLSVHHGEKYEYGHAVSVLNLNADGIIEFNTWGQKFTGRIVSTGPLDPKERPAVSGAPSERYEIVLDASNDLPQWMKDREVRFLMDPTRWDNLHMVVPFVKKKS